jgi:ketosteroid isomerase-like protein
MDRTMTDIQRISDTLAILALQVDYARGADSFDEDTYAQAFTEDGVLDASHCGLTPVRGRQAIAAEIANAYRQQTHNIHYVTNQMVLWIEGDRAAGFAYFFQRSILKNGGRTEFCGRYDDEYRRTAAGWKISKRVLIELLPTVLEGYELGEKS